MSGIQEAPMLEDAQNVNRSILTENERQKEIPKLCKCGCGMTTNKATQNHKRLNIKKGEHFNFIYGHNIKKLRELNHAWKGGKIFKNGYPMTMKYGHSRSHKKDGYVLDHLIIAEKVLGRPIPRKVQIHHVDGNPSNNKNSNLVICEDQTYHFLLHRKATALKKCGNANYLKCVFCKKYDSPSIIKQVKNTFYHKECCVENTRRLRKLKKIAEIGLK